MMVVVTVFQFQYGTIKSLYPEDKEFHFKISIPVWYD